MTEEQIPSGTHNKPKIPRLRSPNYPVVGLEDALIRAEGLNEIGRGHYVPITTARETWQYQKAAGDRLVAALRAYGLIEVTGDGGDKRQIRASESGKKILENHSTRAQLLKEAALKPELHRELWEKYQGNLPTDVVIREFLQWDKKFNKGNIDKFIKQFRESIAFANLTEADKINSGENETVDKSGGQSNAQTGQRTGQDNPPQFNPSVIPPRNDAPEIGEDVLSFNLSRTGKAHVRFNGLITQEAIRKLIALLDLSVDTYPTQGELIQPKQAMWRNKDHDLPVTVTGELGENGGKQYYSIAESDTGIPEDELDFGKSSAEGI
jgi:DNA-binding MarR family transcriptional regulator